ncbi:MAG TPA: hypothetical protein VGS22_17255 [Thermoanaerobaculia bacterium]|jgi:hypothetical protein|nr:hypothetical protein [Thermoanaerobaculia bacterium]
MPLFDALTPSLPSRNKPRSGSRTESPAPTDSAAPSQLTDLRERDLFRHLSRLLDRRLSTLKLTDNQRTILSFRPEGPAPARFQIRLHRSFLWAPEEVLKAVSIFVQSRKKSPRAQEALLRIREHFAQNRGGAERKRRIVLRPFGEAYDLEKLRDHVVELHFSARDLAGRPEVPITWGRQGRWRRPTRRRTSTIQLGSYNFEDHVIRIHPLLDDPEVPRYVVESVIYHELLHAAMPPVADGGRRCIHSPEFRRRELLFPEHRRAERWIAEKLPDFLMARSPRRNAR